MKKITVKIKLLHVLCSDCREHLKKQLNINDVIEIEAKVIYDNYWIACPQCKCWKILNKKFFEMT